MASIRKRVTSRGQTRYQVRWIEDGRAQAATLPTRDAAKTFRGRVESAGDRWPDDDTPAAAAPTLRVYAVDFFASLSGVTPRTHHDYRRDLDAYILPTFGDVPLDLIDRAAVGRWVRALEQREKPPAAKTIANLHGLLSSVLAAAVDDKHISGNPAHGTSLPTGQKEEACFLTPQEFSLVRSAIPRADDKALAATLAGTGMRWGEVSALEVQRVDLLAATPRLAVVQAWKRQPNSSYALGPPKTPRSRRTITLDPEVVDALLPHVAGKTGAELVFPGRGGGRYRHANFYRVWQPAIAKARKEGLEKSPRLHDLRHSHASWLIAAGVPLVAIQRRLGHESITTTIDLYGHLAPDTDLGAAAAITEALRV